MAIIFKTNTNTLLPKLPQVQVDPEIQRFWEELLKTLRDLNISLDADLSSLSDHGLLSGLLDDDHTQYLLADGTRDLTGDWTIATNDITLTAGTLTANTVIGINVTSGANPGHTHTGTSLSAIDISADTNLTVTAPITLTDDDIGFNGDYGDISGNDVDTDVTGAELETLTDGSVADALHSHTGASLSTIDISTDTNLTVTAPITLTDDDIGFDGDYSDISGNDTDTDVTGAELETLSDDSMADTLHRHSELSASDGTPDAILHVDADGVVLIGSDANTTDFTQAQTISSHSNSSQTDSSRIGVVGEAAASNPYKGIGVWGCGKTNGASEGIGVFGRGYVSNAMDTADAKGVEGRTTVSRPGTKRNIGVYGYAVNAQAGYNFSFYGGSGDLYNAADIRTGASFEGSAGTSINEFSTDGTLGGNSDNAVPTEQAVKTYVDASVSDPIPVGSIVMTGRSTAPSGWLICDGSAVSRSTYSDLYSAIGTAFGVGNGSTTFNLPDFQGAFPRGVGTSTQFTQDHTTTLGTYEDDSMQGHYHEFGTGVHGTADNVNPDSGAGGGTFEGIVVGTVGGGTVVVKNPYTDGVNGAPRTSNETRPNNLGVNFIIKYRL